MAETEDEPHWRLIESRRVHSGRVILCEHTVELPTGEVTTYEVEESVPFSAATLIVEDGRVCLSRQYRYPIDRWILDIPGGGGEPGERPVDAAARECREELGLDPVSLEPLTTYYANPGRSAWTVHLFFCRETRPTRLTTSDAAEQVHPVWLGIDELDRLILTGEIGDPSLLIARSSATARGLLPSIV